MDLAENLNKWPGANSSKHGILNNRRVRIKNKYPSSHESNGLRILSLKLKFDHFNFKLNFRRFHREKEEKK